MPVGALERSVDGGVLANWLLLDAEATSTEVDGLFPEAFGESQEAVDGYLELFDRVVADEGVVYLSNAHDYVFTGEWNYPARGI